MKTFLIGVAAIVFYFILRMIGVEITPIGAVLIGALFGLIDAMTD